MCVTMPTLDGAIKSFEITDPRPFKRNPDEPGSGPVEHYAWNWSSQGILYGAGVTSEARISFPVPEPAEPLKILPVSHTYKGCRVGVGAAALCPRDQNRSRQDILLSAGVLATADTFPDFEAGV